MDKEFVPYKLRTNLIELGYYYDAVCYHRGDMKGQPIISKETAVRLHGSTDCLNHPAILYQQAFKWFREKYNLLSEIGLRDREDLSTWKFEITIIGKYEMKHNSTSYNTYEKAELACLKRLIELVKT